METSTYYCISECPALENDKVITENLRYTFYGAARLAALLTRRSNTTHHVHMKTDSGWLNVGRIEP